ncbi:unnamed protein product [Rhizophagus irregularis]|nr:unnamed protein product [Rhizophagus irregularis]
MALRIAPPFLNIHPAIKQMALDLLTLNASTTQILNDNQKFVEQKCKSQVIIDNYQLLLKPSDISNFMRKFHKSQLKINTRMLVEQSLENIFGETSGNNDSKVKDDISIINESCFHYKAKTKDSAKGTSQIIKLRKEVKQYIKGVLTQIKNMDSINGIKLAIQNLQNVFQVRLNAAKNNQSAQICALLEGAIQFLKYLMSHWMVISWSSRSSLKRILQQQLENELSQRKNQYLSNDQKLNYQTIKENYYRYAYFEADEVRDCSAKRIFASGGIDKFNFIDNELLVQVKSETHMDLIYTVCVANVLIFLTQEHIELKQNDEVTESFQSFNLENINSLAITEQEFVHTCSTIKNTINSLNDVFKIIQNFNNLLIFDTEENYNAFTKGKEALEKLMQRDEWKIVQNEFQSIQFYKKQLKKPYITNTITNTSELVSLSPSKKQKRHESYNV